MNTTVGKDSLKGKDVEMPGAEEVVRELATIACWHSDVQIGFKRFNRDQPRAAHADRFEFAMLTMRRTY